jgi:hypothetical protein
LSPTARTTSVWIAKLVFDGRDDSQPHSRLGTILVSHAMWEMLLERDRRALRIHLSYGDAGFVELARVVDATLDQQPCSKE